MSELFCCECAMKVPARLTDGREIYPHRNDLKSVPFWKCDTCRNYVGCHHKTGNPTRPLGCIPNAALRKARQQIHALIDPAWQSGRVTRKGLYRHLTEATGRKYHTANIRTIEEAREVYRLASGFIQNS